MERKLNRNTKVSELKANLYNESVLQTSDLTKAQILQ